GDAAAQQLLRDREHAPLRHARPALWPSVLEHEDGIRVDIEIWIVDPSAEVVDVFEDDRLPTMAKQRFGGGAALDNCSRRWKVSSVRLIPARPAIAIRCMTALVEPPIAISTVIALLKASRVKMRDGLRSSRTNSTARLPVASAAARRLASTAGIAADPVSAIPSASTTI